MISFFLFSSSHSLHTAGECDKHNDTVQLETSRWHKRQSLSRASVGGVQRDGEQEHKWNQHCIWKPAFWLRIQNICGCFNLLYEYQYLDDSSDRYFIRIFSFFFISRLTYTWPDSEDLFHCAPSWTWISYKLKRIGRGRPNFQTLKTNLQIFNGAKIQSFLYLSAIFKTLLN